MRPWQLNFAMNWSLTWARMCSNLRAYRLFLWGGVLTFTGIYTTRTAGINSAPTCLVDIGKLAAGL